MTTGIMTASSFLLLVLSLVAPARAAESKAAASRPNIIFILADDAGLGEVSQQ